MKEYISRHRVLEELHKWCDPCGSGIEAILAVPAEDVAPVVYAKWIAIGKGRSKHADVFACSVCNKCEPYISSYCPNCGAKMDREDTGDNNAGREID